MLLSKTKNHEREMVTKTHSSSRCLSASRFLARYSYSSIHQQNDYRLIMAHFHAQVPRQRKVELISSQNHPPPPPPRLRRLDTIDATANSHNRTRGHVKSSTRRKRDQQRRQ